MKNVEIPDVPIVANAYAFAASLVHESVLNHSIRVGVYASAIATFERADSLDVEVLWIAALLHDLGTTIGAGSPIRFEVAGAHAATEHLRNAQLPEEAVSAVWDAIALHTSPQIAEERGGYSRYLRLGVLADFGAAVIPKIGTLRSAAELSYPRLDIERVLTDAVVTQALECADKAPPASWPHGLLAAHLTDPGRPGVSPAF